MSSVKDGWAHVVLPSVFRWMRDVSGGMRFGRIFVRIVELNCNSEELVLTNGYWDIVMGLRAEFIILSLEMIGS